MIDPFNPNHRKNLFKAVKSSRKDLLWTRQKREDLIKEYVGRHYNDSQIPDVKANLLHQTATYYTTMLAYQRPQYVVTSEQQDAKLFSEQFALGLNNYASRLHLEAEYAWCVLDAFFSFGLTKTFMADSPYLQSKPGEQILTGAPAIRRISPDDWVHDSKSKRFDECRFMGDGYSVPFAALKKDPILYDQDEVKHLKPRSKYNSHHDEAKSVGQSQVVDWDEIEPMIDLVDFFLPETMEWVTFAIEKWETWEIQDTNPITVTKMDYHPYDMLSFGMVPDNIIPVSPALNLASLHKLYNNLLNRLSKQAARQKDLLLYNPQDEDEAKRAKQSEDGAWIKSQTPDQFSLVKLWGPDQQVGVFAEMARNLFNEHAGNVRSAMGMAADADTATQEGMLAQNRGTTEDFLRGKMLRFCASGGRKMGKLLWEDPITTVPGEMTVPGTDINVRVDWTPDNRLGRFEDFIFEVEPYSMQYRDPRQRLFELEQKVLNFWLPVEQSGRLMQAGMEVDFQEILHLQALLGDEPRFKHIIKVSGQDPSQMPDNGGGNGAPTSPGGNEPHHYIRHNRSEQAPGAAQKMMASVMNGQSQPSQMQGTG